MLFQSILWIYKDVHNILLNEKISVFSIILLFKISICLHGFVSIEKSLVWIVSGPHILGLRRLFKITFTFSHFHIFIMNINVY